MNEIIVTPLGTVSPYCKGDKNCPGFLIEHNGYKVLLDCGEGVSSLLNFPNDLKKLIIIISHLHHDHYTGLSGIGYASYVNKNFGYLKDKIKIYLPKGDTIKVVKNCKDNDGWEYSTNVEAPLPDFEYLMNYGNENHFEFIPYKGDEKIVHGDMIITFEQNPHQLITYSTKIENDCGTIVYSADTGYEDNSLEDFAKDADLLICESSFLKGQYRKSDNHLYAHEAAEIARDANVNKLLLTHFWPEIDKQRYVEEAKEIFNNVEAAEEGKKLILRR